MDISSLAATQYDVVTRGQQTAVAPPSQSGTDDKELREAFQDFVGQTFYGQMLSAMRKSVGRPAYLYGGRTEEVFQQQLDQVLAEKLSDATADTFAEPMYQLFTLSRR
jgi:Rod binding domain-containing protein